MSLETKRWIIGILGLLFLVSLILVQWLEVQRRQGEGDRRSAHVVVPTNSKGCVECHAKITPAIIDHWGYSTHAHKGIGCVECHQASREDADGFEHYGEVIATIVTPRDCSRCHKQEYQEFAHSHHAKGGNILASLDNVLAERVEGHPEPFAPFNPHAVAKPGSAVLTPGRSLDMVNGLASAVSGCKTCHGSKVALQSTTGGRITRDDLDPDPDTGKPRKKEALALIKKNEDGRPMLDSTTWPNHGIGRLNLDGSLGSCSACHSRHDFSPRRARQPENCGRCHLGPDHPQSEIYEESMHGIAYRDLKDKLNLDSKKWVLGEDYSQAPTCATCHMSGHSRNKGKVSHDAGARISWTNRPPVSEMKENAAERRDQMKQVCSHCHSKDYVNAFYQQYDDFLVLYNEKFAKPGQAIMKSLYDNQLLTPKPADFDEVIEWTWFYLWHHEGRRARHGTAMMAPDYSHWHGMYEVAERFYMHLIPQAREIAHKAEEAGHSDKAKAVQDVIEGILSRPEHRWYEKDMAEHRKMFLKKN